MSDVSGALYNPNGLNIPELVDHVAHSPNRVIAGYTAPGVEELPRPDLLTLDVEVLVAAALEGQITADNAVGSGPRSSWKVPTGRPPRRRT